jgi:hypothetical protein
MAARFVARSGSRPERVAANASAARAQRERNAGRSCRLASSGTSFRFVRAPLASFPIHDVKQRSLLRSRGALCPRVSFPSASLRIFRPNEGRRSAGAGHWVVRRACEARRLASRATGGRLSALHVAIFGCGTGASSSGSAHRNPRRDLAHGQAFPPGRSGPHLPRPRFAPPPGTPLPRSALKASPETPLVSEDNHIITTYS